MKKWYQSIWMKMLLIVIALIMPVIATFSILIVGNSLSWQDEFFEPSAKNYEGSDNFNQLMESVTGKIVRQIELKELFEVDGVYDPDQLVDVVQFYKDSTINSDNASGLSYTVDQLADWGEEWTEAGYSYSMGESSEVPNVIVCQKADGTYTYYLVSELESLLEAKKLEVKTAGSEEFLSNLKDGEYGEYTTVDGDSYSSGNMQILNEKGEVEYTDCWLYDNGISDIFSAEDIAGMLKIVNENPEWNGKLSKVMSYMETVILSMTSLRDEYMDITNQWDEGNSNYSYLYLDKKQKKLYTNNSQWADYDAAENAINDAVMNAQKDSGDMRYVVIQPKLKDCASNLEYAADLSEWQTTVTNSIDLGEDGAFLAAVDTSYPVQDMFYKNKESYESYAPYISIAKAAMILSVFVFIIAVVWLTCIAGRSNRFDMTDSAEGSRSAGDKVTAEGSRSAGDKITAEGSRSAGTVCLTGFDKIKSELAAALVIGPWILLTVLVAENCWYYSSTVLIIPIISYAFLTTALFLIGYLSLVRRIKAHILWKESLLRMFCGWLRKAGSRVKEFWRQRRLLWKIVILYLGFILLHWIAIISFDSTNSWLILSIIVECVVGVIILRYAVDRDKITTGIKKIAGGEVEYKIPTEKLKGEALAEAERVNSIGEGMEVALEKSMKSERLKTDLITNVSHDIKTPLTSIINYVDLLKQENFEDPKIRRYIEVLEQKSQRLKTLTEDVVEASKVSSGNITLEYTKLNLVEMIQQTSGEFAEKFAARDLIEVMNFSEQEAVIRADGRRMWRVFSNIYNNVAKYAMPGTRVYADLVVEEARVKFDLKNISEQSLNISSDELTERFIRGDISRSTEGSGLGLSIAKTLTEMQGGTFEIYLDGDLFRVSITFPLAE